METIAERVARLKARQASNEDVDRQRSALIRAGAAYRHAQDFPRCGEGWPANAAERAHDALLRGNPEFAAGVEE